MTERLSLPDIEALSRDCLTRAGTPARAASAVAAEVTAAEAFGARTHGLAALLRDLHAIRYGHLDPAAEAQRMQPKPALMILDAQHGFAAAALDGAIDALAALARAEGIALLRLDHGSPAGAMIRPVTRLSQDHGLAALAYGQAKSGRFAHPDGRPHVTLEDRPALQPWLGLLGQSGELLDDPFAGPADHSAWLIAGDPAQIGSDKLTPDPSSARPTPARAEDVAVPTALLEQIMGA